MQVSNFSCVIVLFVFLATTHGKLAWSEPLRYTIKPQQVVPYSVTITAELPGSTETMTGIITLTGMGQEDEKLLLRYSGGLTKSTQPRAGEGGLGGNRPWFGGPAIRWPEIPRGPFGRPQFGGLASSTSTLVLTRTGEIESMRGETQLPYLLGNLALMPFELLPESERKKWQSIRGLTITEKSSGSSRFSPLAVDNDERIKAGGQVAVQYQIKAMNQERVTITKDYSLTSPASTRNDTAIGIQGTGDWIFNRKLGVSESMDFKATMTINTINTEVKVPLSIQWKRMPEADYEAHVQARNERIAILKKQAEERRAQEEAAAKERAGKPLDAKEKQTILADLDSSQWPVTARRLRSLEGFHPHPDDFDVAMHVKELCSHKSISVSMAARKLWEQLEPILEAAEASVQEASLSSLATRLWSDDSGSFQVYAQLVSLKDDQVVIQRDDGKVLNVPVERLSEADQAFIQAIRADQAANQEPVNPFE